MEYVIKKLNEPEIEITIDMEKSPIEKAALEKIRNLKNTIQISGFRKGKVPIGLIEKKYGQSVKEEMLSKILEKNIRDIIVKEKMKPINSPSVKKIDEEQDKNYKFVISFETFPIVKVKNIKFCIEKPVVSLNDQNIESIINNIKEEFATWNEVERKSLLNDKVKIEYTLFKYGENKKSCSQTTEIELKEENEIRDKEKVFYIKLDNFSKEKEYILDIKNNLKENNYKIRFRILSVKEKKQIQSDKEISKIIKCKSDDIKDIKDQIKRNTTKQIEEITNNFLKNEILEKLYQENKFIVPKSLTNNQNNHLEKNSQKELEKKIVIELLIKEIIKKENIKIKKMDVQEKLNNLYRNNPILKSEKIKDKIVNNIKNELLIENVISFMLQKSEITNKNISLENFLIKYKT